MNEALVSGHALNNVHNAEFEMLRTRRFAQKMKGTICAENATPSGAKFIIEMP